MTETPASDSDVDIDIEYLKIVVEAALLAAGEPLSLNQLNALFPDEEKPGHGPLKQALAALDADMAGRAVELTEVGSGFRLQIRSRLMPVIGRLWTEKPPRYSRALLETLAIIAYRQPITRGEIEQIRGVSLSANILRTLQERDWIKVVGHRDVPGRPELLGTTKAFLDYFNLKSLDQLPTLAEIKDIDNLEPELELVHPTPPPGPPTDKEEQHEAESLEAEAEADGAVVETGSEDGPASVEPDGTASTDERVEDEDENEAKPEPRQPPEPSGQH